MRFTFEGFTAYVAFLVDRCLLKLLLNPNKF
jgi:hypothetical protein